ncbi:glycoside hydrolase family 31 protein [bacterium]|nr:MAG: glycoside hydrolase family 31 protein [bacterium]
MTSKSSPYFRTLSLGLALVGTSAAFSNSAFAAPAQQLKIQAVDTGTFHLLAYPDGLPAPAPSPFVVKRSDLPGAKVQHHATASSVTAPAGAFVIDAQGKWEFKGSGKTLSGTVQSEAGKTTFTLKHGPGERFYGAGNETRDVSGPLTHPSGTVEVGNGFTRVPFLWSTAGYSIFVANNHAGSQWKDENGTLTWTIPNSYADVYLSVAPDAYGLLGAYARLTGPAIMPPKWTFGFLMSKWGYKDKADIRDKWTQFRSRNIPVDAFIYDYEWFKDDWKFNEENLSPKDIADMHAMGLHMGGIRKPRVNGANLEFAKRMNWILTGNDLRYDLPEAAYWWWSHQAPLAKAGVDGWWNDEAEQTLDEYFHMSKTQFLGWKAMSPRRSWMINRAFAPGIQRLGAATWTGDTHGSWANLKHQKGIMLNWSLAGMPFTSDDIGGFETDGVPNAEAFARATENLEVKNLPVPELYTRWMQSSAFGPVMRAHCVFWENRWPWAFGPEAEAATKKAIELRYRMIPFLYTLAEETTRTGAPIMRPMLLEYPQDPKTVDMRDQWLMGSRLLVAPVMDQGGKRDVYLPAGNWFDFNTGAAVKGGQTLSIEAPLDVIPLYVRAGSIIPLGPIMQSTMLGKSDPLEVRIYPGANASYSLYEDDGDNYDYQKGASTRIPMSWDNATKTLTVGKRMGTYPGMLMTRNLVVSLPGQPAKKVSYSGAKISIKL